MVNTHEPLQALSPTDWSDVPQDDPGLAEYVNDILCQSMIVADSIPSPTSATSAADGSTSRARSKTESAVMPDHANPSSRALRRPLSAAAIEAASALRKGWKEVKVSPKENPLGINVFKLSSKDGRGAWFARQSVHEGLSFDTWRAGLEREFGETLKVQGSPGVGNIRGIGADRHVENREIQDAGHLSVFQLSAQFPGPTSPRDFITLLLTSDFSHKTQYQSDGLRQYMIVSKPCNHSQCPPRQGIIRGQYESVEVIREVHAEQVAAQRSMSVLDLSVSENGRAGADAKPAGSQSPRTTAIEWLMVTRSDPGGSVPRFLVEKGTPPGIVGDAGKFLEWLTKMSQKGWETAEDADDKEKLVDDATPDGPATATNNITSVSATKNDNGINEKSQYQYNAGADSIPSSNGLYGVITGIFGAASSVVSHGLGLNYASSEESVSTIPAHTVYEHQSSDSDSSSVSFLSALEKNLTLEKGDQYDIGDKMQDGSPSEGSKSTSTSQDPAAASRTAAGENGGRPGEKELRKLEERRRKTEEKMALMRARLQSRSEGDRAKDEAALAKLREKLDRETAKREHKYRRELRKIDEKREQEARRAERRRRKTAEREERSSLALELERTRAERDLSRRHGQILEDQVRALQAQNTQLVARLGKLEAGSDGVFDVDGLAAGQ